MRYLLLILFIFNQLFSEEYFFEPGEEVLIELESKIESGDKILIEVDNFTMFLPEFIETTQEYPLIAENYGVFKSEELDDFEGLLRVRGLALFGNSDSCNFRIKILKNELDTVLIGSVSFKNLDTNSRNNFQRFSEISKIYPMPLRLNQEINIEYVNDYKTDLDLRLYDLMGKEIKAIKFKGLEPGLNQLKISLPEDPLNNYFFIVLEDENNLLQGKVVVIN
jgi:hypothetical protein